jgi:autotransporter-associated beta strand protein
MPTRLLVFASLLALSAQGQVIWSGGDATGFWSAPLNWAGGVPPGDGQSLEFAGELNLAATNDLPAGVAFSGITFAAGAGTFTLSGATIALAGGVTNNAANPQILALPVELAAGSRTLRATSGNLVISGELSGPGSAVFGGSNNRAILITTPGTWTGGQMFVGQNLATPVTNFTLVNAVTNAVPTNVVVTVQASNTGTHTARWDLNGFDQTVAGLASIGGNTRILTNSSATPSVLTLANPTAQTYVSQITGNLSVVKIGDSRQDLTNTSGGLSHTGDTLIRAGALAYTLANGPLNSRLVLDGGVFQNTTAATFTRTVGAAGGAGVQWTENGGGFSARGGLLTVNLGGAATPETIDWLNGPGTGLVGPLKFIHSGSADNRVLFQNGLRLNGAQREVWVGDNTGSANDLAELAGALEDGAGGPGGLIKRDNGLLRLSGPNTYSGSTDLRAGTVQISALADSGLSHLGTGTLILNGGLLEFNATGAGTNTTARAWRVEGTGGGVRVTNAGQTLRWTTAPEGSGDLSLSGNGTVELSADAPAFSGGVSLGGGTSSTFNGTSGVQAGFVRLGGDLALGSGRINSRGMQIQPGAPSVSLDNDIDVHAGGLRLGGEGELVFHGTVAAVAGLRGIGIYHPNLSVWFTGEMQTGTSGLAVDGNDGVAATGPVTFQGPITGPGVFEIGTTYDNGVVTLAVANTFAGGLNLRSSRMRLGHDQAPGAGTIQFAGASGLSSTGADARVVTNALVLAANPTLGHAVDHGPLTFTGPVNLNGGARTFTVLSAVQLQGAITNGTLNIKQGDGALTLQGRLLSNGATEIRRGLLRLECPEATFGDAVRVMGSTAGFGAALEIAAGSTNTILNVASNMRVGYSTGAAVTNTLDVAGVLRMSPGGTGARLLLGPQGTRNVFRLLAGGRVQTRQIAEEAGTSFSVVQFDGGMVEVLPDSPGANARHATFLQGLDDAQLLAGGVTLDTAGSTVTIAQNLTGPGGLVKQGAGGVVLTGSDLTYAGPTAVHAGELVLNGALNGGGGVVVEAGGRLSGSGVCLGGLEIRAGGVFAPGTGALPVFNAAGDLTLAGVWEAEANGVSADLVSGVGHLELRPGSALDVVGIPTAASLVLARYTTRSGQFGDTTAAAARGYAVVYDDFAGEVRLERGPAPSLAVLADTPAEWDAYLGRLYTLEYRTNLLQGVWVPFPGYLSLPGTGGRLRFTNDLPAEVRGYFRVREE